MHHIKDSDEFETLVKNAGPDKLVVVDFYATWCGPCKVVGPKIEAMSKELTSVMFYKVDVDEVEDVAQKCEISAMPTFLLFKNGVKVETVVGASADKVREAIQKHI